MHQFFLFINFHLNKKNSFSVRQLWELVTCFFYGKDAVFHFAIKPAEQHNPSNCFVIDSGKVYAKEVTSTKRKLYMIANICVNSISSDLLMGGKNLPTKSQFDVSSKAVIKHIKEILLLQEKKKWQISFLFFVPSTLRCLCWDN